MGEHSGRVAIVTGGAKGIGGAIVDRLATAGATIAIFDIDADAAQQKVEALNAAGTAAQAWQMWMSPSAPRSRPRWTERSRRSAPRICSSTTPA